MLEGAGVQIAFRTPLKIACTGAKAPLEEREFSGLEAEPRPQPNGKNDAGDRDPE